jgi:hypothetical protein
MGRLRRSRRWTSILGAAAMLGVALNGVAAAETDPSATTNVPPTTSAPAPSTSAPPTAAAAPPTTTTPPAPSGGSSDTKGRVGGAPTPSGGTGGAAVAAAAVDAADLGVTNSDSPDPVTAGANVTYTITITNAGPSDA